MLKTLFYGILYSLFYIFNYGLLYYKNVPIIALTANAVSGTKEMFLENGFNDFLSKPIDTVKLHEILKKWIPKEKQIAA